MALNFLQKTKHKIIMSRETKIFLLKGLRLQKYFDAYKVKAQRQQTINKFTEVWGSFMANHFLSKYDDADSLIWALDSENLELFINKF